MTDTHISRPPVTVPIGLGGKTTPYVPDPAPTLMIELPSVETNQELARIAALQAAAEDEAHRIIEGALATAEQIRQEAVEAADGERQAVQREIAEQRDALDRERVELAQLAEDLENRSRELDARSAALDARLSRADDDVAEAARILADARTDAETILHEAQAAAEAIIQDAVSQAQDTASELIGEARNSVDADELLSERLAEVEAMHRVEVQVLTQREAELLERIASLEASLPTTDQADTPMAPDAVGAAVDHDELATVVPERTVRGGRHSSDSTDPTNRTIASHAPLTEQLSTTAFRSVADRKGKRRR